MKSVDRIDYTALDRAKNAFIEASKKTAGFAHRFGFMPGEKFGASANVFALDLQPFFKAGAESLHVTLLPEGLGTADDARPNDLTPEELRRFWKNIGLKTMSTLTNDAASSGMQTVLLSLYLPSAQPERVFTPEFMDGFLTGIVQGCQTIGCVYFSGETPQLKTKLVEGQLDIAGALFGLVPAGQVPIDSSELQVGDTIVFVSSSGPHENGFTTLRDLAKSLPQGYRTQLPSGMEYWEAINQPGILYTPLIQAFLAKGVRPSNVEPITGHGWQKLMRSKGAYSYVIETVGPRVEVFDFIEKESGMSQEDMLKTFNCGVGMAVFVHSKTEAETVVATAKELGIGAYIAGQVEMGPVDQDGQAAREVVVKPLGVTLKGEAFALGK